MYREGGDGGKLCDCGAGGGGGGVSLKEPNCEAGCGFFLYRSECWQRRNAREGPESAVKANCNDTLCAAIGNGNYCTVTERGVR
jgi:hypothetical protein